MPRSLRVFLVVLLAALIGPAALVQTVASADEGGKPSNLTIAQLESPRDLEELGSPLLAWNVPFARQSAYRVQVAEITHGIGAARVWDSGRVASSVSTNVAYGGPELRPEQTYKWRVRVWDEAGKASDWSDTAVFGTGPGQAWGEARTIWLAPSESTVWSDVVIDTTFRIDNQNATIVFRAKDLNNYYMWQFRGNGVNTFAPHKRVGGGFTVLGTVPLATPLVTGQSYRLRIEAIGSRISTWLDGALIDTRTLTDFANGTIGFRTGGTERNSWDAITVTDPAGATLYSNDFSQPSSDFSCGTVSGGWLRIGTGANCIYGVESNDWAFLRTEFDVPDKEIAAATFFATASSTAPGKQYVYKAWLNGEFVGLGPTQPIKGEARYDGFDVTPQLRRGAANAIGILGWTSSDRRFLGRLVIEYADGTRDAIVTDSSWQSLTGAPVFPQAGSIGTSVYTAPRENVQVARWPEGFALPGFDATGWRGVEVKAPFAKLAAAPMAKVEQQLRLPESVVEKAPGHYFIDYGRTWLGGLSLDLNGSAGQVLDIRFGEELSAPMTVRFAMRTGNTYQDRPTLREGQQHLETWGMRVFRYAEVIGAPQGLGRDDFPALAQVYPFDTSEAIFESSDDGLNQVWELSRNTIEATNHNLYVDSWTRERIAYEADSYLQMMANFFVSSDPTLGNYSLEYLLTGRTWPTEWPIYTILAFHDSWLQTGDTSALARNYDALRSKLPTRWLEASTGLIRKDTGSSGAGSCTDCDIVDWPTSERDGYVFRPYNTVINAISHQAYRDMADIATALGNDADAADYTAIAERLQAAAVERLWDADKGAFRDGLNADGTPVQHWAVHATVFATAFGLAEGDVAERSADYLGTRGMACSVYCAAFVLEALYDGDRGDVAHQLLTSTGLRSWLNMIAKGAGATAEAWDTSLKGNMTWSHPWAASPAYNIPQGMFGIEPRTPGYSEFLVRPQPGPVSTAHVTLPTLRGKIGASYAVVNGKTDVGVRVPGNSVADVYVPAADSDEVYLDGTLVPAIREGAYLRVDGVPTGCHVLRTGPGTSEASAQLREVC
ncbi:glycoside hydrolase family 78 protein [Tessaracoccus sp. OS52]|uniref:alpha-L-rhamnosidase-related protein n=1 Tax=Tessaracoccus sp. OS52 TaxID=2886691 RepID=UPI001D1265A0|nr:alpha-L-rhamnosidase C-terminal domain-containing protein [Tessaracoccus sp. OS52]MCC2592937.1 glycoside hydrolase family 78 protein [Tessaracoccus sp. OS52]